MLSVETIPKCGLYTQWHSIEQANFFFANVCELEVVSWLGLGARVYFPFSALGPCLA